MAASAAEGKKYDPHVSVGCRESKGPVVCRRNKENVGLCIFSQKKKLLRWPTRGTVENEINIWADLA